jgi:hypothetical protein
MYFPLSQITPNLYTNGGEFVIISSQEDYKGYYFKTSTGKYYTGRNSSDLPNIEITLKSSYNETSNQTVLAYESIIVTELDGPSGAHP